MRQASLFDGAEKFIIDKPIRLIELFAGYGSQALSLKYLGANFEHWKISEWAVKSIQAYKDLHFEDDNTDYAQGMTDEQLGNELERLCISLDHQNPMTRQQINRLSFDNKRKIYNNMKATHNLGSITGVHAKDLEIVDTDKYCYVMSYSYPCTSISIAGKQQGYKKGSGTTSSMLWEVQRILSEVQEGRPQVLLLENVPQAKSDKHGKEFGEWCEFLESLGYKNYYAILNAKEFGIPQNRERIFMVSILGDYLYEFPNAIRLDLKTKDIQELEETIDESYYLTDRQIKYILDFNHICDDTKRGDLGDRVVNPQVAKTISCRGAKDQRADITNFVVGDNSTTYTIELLRSAFVEKGTNSIFIDNEEKRIRTLTSKECFRLQGVKDEDYFKIKPNQSETGLYHLAGDSICSVCLVGIFGQLLGFEWKKTIAEIQNGVMEKPKN